MLHAYVAKSGASVEAVVPDDKGLDRLETLRALGDTTSYTKSFILLFFSPCFPDIVCIPFRAGERRGV